MAQFYEHFRENMKGMGLPAPETLFGTAQTAVGNITLMLNEIDRLGKAVTIGELIGAGTRFERLGVVAGCSAAYYVGAAIGSLAVATGRSLSGGRSQAYVLATAERHRLNRP